VLFVICFENGNNKQNQDKTIMPRLSAEKWMEARLYYEAGASQQATADKFGVSKTAVQKHIESEGWAYDGQSSIYKSESNKNREGFLYLIFIEDSAGKKFYKIGIARTFIDRLKNHQVSSPFNIEVACVYYSRNMAAEESFLHKKFIKKNVRGEWYELTQEDIVFISSRAKI